MEALLVAAGLCGTSRSSASKRSSPQPLRRLFFAAQRMVHRMQGGEGSGEGGQSTRYEVHEGIASTSSKRSDGRDEESDSGPKVAHPAQQQQGPVRHRSESWDDTSLTLSASAPSVATPRHRAEASNDTARAGDGIGEQDGRTAAPGVLPSPRIDFSGELQQTDGLSRAVPLRRQTEPAIPAMPPSAAPVLAGAAPPVASAAPRAQLNSDLEHQLEAQKQQSHLLLLQLEQEKIQLQLEQLKRMRAEMQAPPAPPSQPLNVSQQPAELLEEGIPADARTSVAAEPDSSFDSGGSVPRNAVGSQPYSSMKIEDMAYKEEAGRVAAIEPGESGLQRSEGVPSVASFPERSEDTSEVDFEGDVIGALLRYSSAFLATSLYLAGPASLRGAAARTQLLKGRMGEVNLVNFCIFTQFGTVEGAAVRGIK